HPHVILFSMNRWKYENNWKNDHELNTLLKEDVKNQTSRCVLLLDAFDEYCESRRISDVEAAQLLTELFNWFCQFKAIVIATRPLVGTRIGDDITQLYLCPFTKEEVIK